MGNGTRAECHSKAHSTLQHVEDVKTIEKYGQPSRNGGKKNNEHLIPTMRQLATDYTSQCTAAAITAIKYQSVRAHGAGVKVFPFVLQWFVNGGCRGITSGQTPQVVTDE